jgi:hypothetical protein
MLLEKDGSTHSKDEYGRIPMSWAAQGGREEAELLLAKGGVLGQGRTGPNAAVVDGMRCSSLGSEGEDYYESAGRVGELYS